MKCRVCGKETTIKIKSYNLAICENCFLKRLWGRVGETIRRYSMFGRKEGVYILREGKNAQVLAGILGDMNYEFNIVERVESVPEGGILVLGKLLEDEVTDAIWRILNWEISEDLAPVYTQGNIKVVKPLCLIIEEEISHYRSIKGITEERGGEENWLKEKLRERKLLSAGFLLAFYKSFVKEKDKFK